MNKIFKYPDKLPITLKRHIDAQIDAYEAIASHLSPEEAQEIAPHFQTQIDKLLLNIEEEKRLSRIEIGEKKKSENLLRIATQRELKETLLKKDKQRKQKRKEVEEARLKEEKKLREKKEASERLKSWHQNELKFYSGLIVTFILCILFFNFITLFLIFAAAYFYACIDYSFLKRPRPNFSSSRGPTEIKVNLPTHQIEDAVQKAIITSLYQPGFTSRTSESISRGIEDALKNMKYK